MFAVPPNTVSPTGVPPSAHPAVLVRELAADVERWSRLVRHVGRHGARRLSLLVERTDDQEIWLMSWLPGQRTDLHNHGGATGAFTVVSGQLHERVVRRSGTEPIRQTVHRVTPGLCRVFGPGYVHKVHNDGLVPAISLHVYRPAKLPPIRYRFAGGGLARAA
jgi:predicted metal-dependent enzyme (double-stranded beta helix superfamily)